MTFRCCRPKGRSNMLFECNAFVLVGLRPTDAILCFFSRLLHSVLGFRVVRFLGGFRVVVVVLGFRVVVFGLGFRVVVFGLGFRVVVFDLGFRFAGFRLKLRVFRAAQAPRGLFY